MVSAQATQCIIKKHIFEKTDNLLNNLYKWKGQLYKGSLAFAQVFPSMNIQAFCQWEIINYSLCRLKSPQCFTFLTHIFFNYAHVHAFVLRAVQPVGLSYLSALWNAFVVGFVAFSPTNYRKKALRTACCPPALLTSNRTGPVQFFKLFNLFFNQI